MLYHRRNKNSKKPTVSEPSFLNSTSNSTMPRPRVSVKHEGTHSGRGVWEQNSHRVKLQLIIIATDNKTRHKRVEAMLTPFIMHTKAKEMNYLSLSHLLKEWHLGG